VQFFIFNVKIDAVSSSKAFAVSFCCSN